MTSVLDFNPTKEEREDCIGDFTNEELVEMSQDSHYVMIASVLWCRGEDERAKEYIAKIKDDQLRLDAYRSQSHPIPPIPQE